MRSKYAARASYAGPVWLLSLRNPLDVIASPTLCLTPPLMSEVADPDRHLRVNRRIVCNTAAVNYLGLCAITMPVGRDRAGMPARSAVDRARSCRN